MSKVGSFFLGVLTTLVILLGVFVYNTVSIRTQTTYTYNPNGIVSLFGSYSEVTR